VALLSVSDVRKGWRMSSTSLSSLRISETLTAYIGSGVTTGWYRTGAPLQAWLHVRLNSDSRH
jgi:hypothetical protein